MRSVTKALALVVALACLMPGLVRAQDYITDAANALTETAVYVAPGTENIDSSAALELKKILTTDDRIVLVILPAIAAEDLDLSPLEIATTLSELLGDQRIIGLAVGDITIGYAPYLPSNVAADMMQRAGEVSRNPVSTLVTFVNYMHGWLAQNPQPKQIPTPVPTPKPSTPSTSTDEGGSAWQIMAIIPTMSVVLVGGAIYFRRRQLHQVPLSVQDLLNHIALKREKIHSSNDRHSLKLVEEYTERYFRSTSKDRKGDSLFFEKNLADINRYLEEVYLDAQAYPHFWTDPAERLAVGSRHFSEFRDHVLSSIRRGTDQKIPEFRQITNEAQALYRLTDDNPNGLDDFERRLQSDNN